ncbi:MAG: putative HTH-type transcriptional regulator YusO [candidate division WS2 bacterium]|uniref:HTH-type transcriptional regulator YusO n=1 Tax=Psychracetigena formicireducens TaxID=2986056 RepID=A0A9E2BFX1_PSYF1|nr:putative HTH-type transcriptional regulator YusO [Candidatus Psychracetigena formicireducens]MBT9144856.1 putative HTH-type transcriptional regulator YusO [Candidatus Psychracetigena formicireducens]
MDINYFNRIEKILRNINHIMNVELRRAASRLDINLTQFYILTFLTSYPLSPIGELSRKFELSPSTMTAHMDILESKGFIVRIREGDDRRVVKLDLTLEGKSFINNLVENRVEVLKKALLNLDQQKHQDIEEVLSYLEGKLLAS